MWLRNVMSANSGPRTAAAALGLALALSSSCAGTSSAADLVVRYDQSQLLRLPRPATEVIIGNPSIADVALQGGNLLVVTGKTFGITNVIALDSDRNVIQDQRVIVERDDRRVVNLHKGSSRYSFSCTPNCEPNLMIGDDEQFFATINKHNSDKTRFSEGSTDGGGSGGGGGASQ